MASSYQHRRANGRAPRIPRTRTVTSIESRRCTQALRQTSGRFYEGLPRSVQRPSLSDNLPARARLRLFKVSSNAFYFNDFRPSDTLGENLTWRHSIWTRSTQNLRPFRMAGTGFFAVASQPQHRLAEVD